VSGVGSAGTGASVLESSMNSASVFTLLNACVDVHVRSAQ
jgi:hypothetical protein